MVGWSTTPARCITSRKSSDCANWRAFSRTSHSKTLHHLAQIFRLRKLAGLLQDIPLQKNDEFIGVSGVAEKLSSSGTIGLAGDTVCIKR